MGDGGVGGGMVVGLKEKTYRTGKGTTSIPP